MVHRDEQGTHAIQGDSFDSQLEPATIRLRPEEKLIAAYIVPNEPPSQPLSAQKALQLLAGVDRPEAIGQRGPVVAARVLPENEKHQELRLYEVLFGRDALIVAWFVFDQFPELTRATVRRLAELQGLTRQEGREEEPGKIVHEVREPSDPIAESLTRERGWEWPYYGTIDATPLFIQAVVRYVQQADQSLLQETYTDRAGNKKTIAEALDAAVGWVLTKMDENPHGFVESRRLNKMGGNVNQAWKDSFDAYHHRDGSLINPDNGITSIEVQAWVYDALLDAAVIYQETGQRAKTKQIAHAAQHLRSSVFQELWREDEQGGYFVLGADRHDNSALRVCDVRASNMGHLLNSRLLDGDDPEIKQQKEMLVQCLMSPALLTKSGIRTLGSEENRFRPNSYHNGSVWLWDTYAISLGLLRQGYTREAHDLWQRILNVIKITKRFPEFVSGADTPAPLLPNRLIRVHDTKYHLEHAIEQPPQDIQAWTVATVVAIEAEQGKLANS